MSDPRYAPGIAQGCAASSGGMYRSFRWPDELPGVGSRALGKFARCVFCPEGIHIAVAGTWTTYGGRPVCEHCAHGLAAGVAR
jgi:hypothetical protein